MITEGDPRFMDSSSYLLQLYNVAFLVCVTVRKGRFTLVTDKIFPGHSQARGSVRFLTTYDETGQASRKSGGNDGRCVYPAPGLPGGSVLCRMLRGILKG